MFSKIFKIFFSSERDTNSKILKMGFSLLIRETKKFRKILQKFSENIRIFKHFLKIMTKMLKDIF